MLRKPSDYSVQTNVRLTPSLRVRLKRAARERGASLNFEIADRLARSFDDAASTIDSIAADVKKLVAQTQGDNG
jgi:hypothetical protein